MNSFEYERTGSIRQRRWRLMEALIRDMAAQYEAGANADQLAAEFGCNRATVAERLKRAGVSLRGYSRILEDSFQ